MGIRKIVKDIPFLRSLSKRVLIYRDYYLDARDYSKYYIDSAEKRGNVEYRIMLLVHSLEKGMCMNDVRPYGQEKAIRLMHLLCESKHKNSFEYRLGISILYSWVHFFEEKGWKKDSGVKLIESYLNGKEVSVKSGKQTYILPSQALQNGNFGQVMLSRHSVRDFEEKELDMEDVEYALRLFVEAPTACNRQMCKAYLIQNEAIKSLLNETVIGNVGFNKKALHYFVITYDMEAFDYSGERNQGFLNAGLVAMNFVNGLHARGIGSCFLQWANSKKQDSYVRNSLALKASERIAVVIATGYYKNETIIPVSCRRDTNDIFKII